MQERFVDTHLRAGQTLFYFDDNGTRTYIAATTAREARERTDVHHGAQVRKTKPGYAKHIIRCKSERREPLSYEGWLTVNALRKSRIDKDFLMGLTSVEEQALSLVRPFDVSTLNPMAVCADTRRWRGIYSYFRYTLSSEAQTRAEARGRKSNWLLMDKTSGAFLGLWSFCSPNLPWAPFDEFVGGKLAGVAAGGSLHAPGTVHPTAMHVIQLSRCIPLYEFGDLTGGKLLTLVAFCKDVVSVLEMEFSQPYVLGIVITLHGKSSQYNRLHANGLEYVGEFTTGDKLGLRGLYVQHIRDNARDYLLEKSHRYGSFVTKSFAESVEFWKKRWLPNRIGMTKNGLVTPDKECYRLSSKLRRYGYEHGSKDERTEEEGSDE